MTHTEFPNHQTAVVSASSESGFNIKNCNESVLKATDPEVLKRLTANSSDIRNVVAEFYEVTARQSEILKEAKVTNPEKYESKGLLPSQWGTFGSTMKTMDEFSNSYETFKAKCIEFIRQKLQEK
jgi:hypothetical protein